MTLATLSIIECDPRMQLGAYITDGIDLYEVTGMQRGPGMLGMSTARIMVENCPNLRCMEFMPDKIRTGFDLVRAAPIGCCPESVDDIPWDPSVPESRAA